MTLGEGTGMTLGGILRDNTQGDPEAIVFSQEMIEELQRIICELNEREQHVMRLRFRLDGSSESVLQDDIAREMKLSRERVRQIELQAIKKLRALAQRRRLREMLSH
jgi:RNA polymerase sigma factor (sigma-70 family)